MLAMMNLFLNVLYHISSWVIIFVALSWLIASFYPLMSRILTKVTAEHAALCILLYGLLVPLAAPAGLIALSLPEFAFPFIADHCHDLDCTPHSLQFTVDKTQTLTIIALFVSLLIAVCTMIIVQLRWNQNKLDMLNRLARPTTSSYKVLDSKAALAWCSGLLKPKIFISRGLSEMLTKEQMQFVLAHEQTHVIRKDNLRKWLIYWATIAWPKRYRIRIRQELSDYTEQVCDLVAVQSEHQTLEISLVMETLEKCYSSIDKNHNSNEANDFIARAQMLKKHWESRSVSHKNSTFTHWLATAFIGSLWCISIILTIHLGHPVLEWLAA